MQSFVEMFYQCSNNKEVLSLCSLLDIFMQTKKEYLLESFITNFPPKKTLI